MSADDVSLSIEETNKLRASLGLKPLKLDAPSSAARPAPRQVEQATAAANDASLQQRLAERQERRRAAELAATRTLGEADPDVDDAAGWVARMRTQQQQQPAASRRQQQRAPAGGDQLGDEEGAKGGDAAAVPELAGAKVKHDVSALAEGETLVLTLADAPLLDKRGRWMEDAPDTLENALMAQEAARARARRAANKGGKPLWEEDGVVRGLLDKYDEEDAEAAAAFDTEGQLAAAAAHAEEVRRRLAEGAAALAGADGPAATAAVSDYMTAEEAAAAAQPLKKKKKKRKLRKAGGGEEEEPVAGEAGGSLDLDALEAEALAAGAGRDLGSRGERASRAAAAAAKTAAAQADKAARFDAAVEKANWASTFLRPGAAAVEVEDPGDEELAASLARARRLAQATAAAGSREGEAGGGGGLLPSMEDLAAQLAKRRQEDEERERQQLAAPGAAADGVELFTETTEFVRAVQAAPGGSTAGGGKGGDSPGGGDSPMDLDDGPSAAAAAAARQQQQQQPQRRKFRKGGWVALEGAEEGQEGEANRAAQGGATDTSPGDPDADDTNITNQQGVGKGLGAALALLKDTGALKSRVEWGGRTNDRKPVALIGLDDVYTGGTSEDAQAARIEAALTQRDEFGRVMTPKDRFRHLCYDFHGMKPSKKQTEKRQRQYLQEVAVTKATTNADPSKAQSSLAAVQQQLGSAYVPLTGKLAPQEDHDEEDAPLPGDVSLARRPGTASAAFPSLGGGTTPLMGKRKVEVMLGISSVGGSSISGKASMPPPAPRPPKRQ